MAAREAWEFAVTIPAGTAKATPITIATVLPTRRIEAVHWRVPRGPKGLMGWQILSSKTQVVPATLGTWMIHDGQSGTFDLPGLPDSGDWQIRGYNTGTFDHLVYVVFVADPIVRTDAPLALTPGGMFAPVPDLSAAGAPIAGRP